MPLKDRKKATKRRKVARIEVAPQPIDAEAVRAAAALLESAAEVYRTRLSELDESAEMPQEMIAVACFARTAAQAMQDIGKVFEANALRLHANHGSFETGRFRVDFDPVKGRNSPAWKEEAIRQAKLLAEETERPFDQEGYIKQVQARTPRSPSRLKPVIRETG